MLADILGVGKPDIPNHTRFHEMFFKVEFPFEEFYSHCIVIFNNFNDFEDFDNFDDFDDFNDINFDEWPKRKITVA